MRFQTHPKFYKEYAVRTNEFKALSDTTIPLCFILKSSDRILLQMTKQLTLLLKISKRKRTNTKNDYKKKKNNCVTTIGIFDDKL